METALAQRPIARFPSATALIAAEEDREVARSLPELHLSRPWLTAEVRVREFVQFFWDRHPAEAQETLIQRLLAILAPVQTARQITPLIRERCEATVVLWLARELPPLPTETMSASPTFGRKRQFQRGR